jgi:hypothetical protein
MKMKEFFVADPATLLESDMQIKRKKSNVKEIEKMFEDFSNFYASNLPLDKKPKYLIAANNKFKIYFDLTVLGSLIFTTIVVPWRLAFSNSDPIGWILVYAVIDFIFLFDLVLTFFTSYTDSQ